MFKITKRSAFILPSQVWVMGLALLILAPGISPADAHIWFYYLAVFAVISSTIGVALYGERTVSKEKSLILRFFFHPVAIFLMWLSFVVVIFQILASGTLLGLLGIVMAAVGAYFFIAILGDLSETETANS